MRERQADSNETPRLDIDARKARFRCRVSTTPEISKRMAAVRQTGTRPELVVRAVAKALGIRFTVDNSDLKGSPDLANRRRKFAVFVHGCFWHRHANCRKCTMPKSNVPFWNEKFAANRARDRAAIAELRRLGYRPVVIWECESRDVNLIARRLSARLTSPAKPPNGW